MSLRKIVGLSLIAFACSTSTILLLGLFVVSPDPLLNTVDSQQTPTDSAQQSTATQQQATQTTNAPQEQTTTPAPQTQPAATPSPTQTSTTPPSSSNPTPTPSTPPPAPACGSAGGACTAAQVATHNSASNCWVIYNSKYYIVTSYVSKHPGGASVFTSSVCGQDIGGYLNGSRSSAGESNKHSSSAYSILNSYYVGPVQ